MKGLKIALVVMACGIITTAVAVVRKTIELGHSAPEMGFYTNDLSEHIANLQIECTSGNLIQGQPLHPGQNLKIDENFNKTKALILTIGKKTFKLDWAYYDGMNNTMKLSENRDFNQIVISKGKGRGEKPYLIFSNFED